MSKELQSVRKENPTSSSCSSPSCMSSSLSSSLDSSPCSVKAKPETGSRYVGMHTRMFHINGDAVGNNPSKRMKLAEVISAGSSISSNTTVSLRTKEEVKAPHEQEDTNEGAKLARIAACDLLNAVTPNGIAEATRKATLHSAQTCGKDTEHKETADFPSSPATTTTSLSTRISAIEKNNKAVDLMKNGAFTDALDLFREAVMSLFPDASIAPAVEVIHDTLKENGPTTTDRRPSDCETAKISLTRPEDFCNANLVHHIVSPETAILSNENSDNSANNSQMIFSMGFDLANVGANAESNAESGTRNLEAFEETISDTVAAIKTPTSGSCNESFDGDDSICWSTNFDERMEFDEGMIIYRETESLLSINADDEERVMHATLLFNTGQAYSNLNKTYIAEMYYRNALETLMPGVQEAIVEESYISDGETDEHHDGVVSVIIARDQSLQQPLPEIIIPVVHSIGLMVYRNGSSLVDAIQYYQIALYQSRAIHGPSHVSVGQCMNCLGVLYYHVGGNSNANLVNATKSSTLALSYFRQSLEILRNSAEGDHDTTLVATVLNNLGRAFVQANDYAAGLDCYKQALEIRKKVLGPQSVDYAATAFNTAQSFQELAQYDQALDLYNEFLHISTLQPKLNNRYVAVVLSCVGQIHHERKQHDMARKLYEQSVQVGQAALGEFHPDVAMLLNRLGNFYFGQKEFDKAIQTYKHGLRIEHKVLHPKHPNVIVTLSNLAEIYRQVGQLNKSLQIFEQVLTLQEQCEEEQNYYRKNNFNTSGAHDKRKTTDVASTLNSMGLIYDQQGNPDAALLKLQQALSIRRSVLGEDHLDVASTLLYIGTILFRQPQHLQQQQLRRYQYYHQGGVISIALHLFHEALRIRIAQLGRDHRDVSFTLYSMGLCHQVQGHYTAAIVCLKETLRVELKLLGNEHRDVALTYSRLGEVYKLEGNYENALIMYQQALSIERKRAVATATIVETSDTNCNHDSGEERKIFSKSCCCAMAKILNEIGNLYLYMGQSFPCCNDSERNVDDEATSLKKHMMKVYTESARFYRLAGYNDEWISIVQLPVSELKLYGSNVFRSSHMLALAA